MEMLSSDSNDNKAQCMYLNSNRGLRRNNNNVGFDGCPSNMGAGSDSVHFLSMDNSTGCDNSYSPNSLLYQQPLSYLTVAASDPGFGDQQNVQNYNSTIGFGGIYASGSYSGSEAGSNPHERDSKRESLPSCVYQKHDLSPRQHTQLASGVNSACPALESCAASNFQPYNRGLSSSMTLPYNPAAPLQFPFAPTTTCSSGMLSKANPWPPTRCSSGMISDVNPWSTTTCSSGMLSNTNPWSTTTCSSEMVSNVNPWPQPSLRYSTHGSSDLRPSSQSHRDNSFHPYNRRGSTSTAHSHRVPLSSPSCLFDPCSSDTPTLLTLPYILDNRYLPGDYLSSNVHNSTSPFIQGNPRTDICPEFPAILTACDRQLVQSSPQSIVSRHNSSKWIANGKNNCKVNLTNGDMWAKFHAYTNEMIVTKHGRRMFPVLHFKISGLDPEKQYRVFVDMILANDNHWKFQGGKWVPCGNADSLLAGGQTYQHPDSPNTGAFWCKQEISFGKLKLTNNKATKQKQVILNSMHWYQPRIHVACCQDGGQQEDEELVCHAFEDTQFIAVTAYQNTDITDLKVKYNPYARGMQDKSRSNNEATSPSPGHFNDDWRWKQ